ncbi:exodeoxyribonuclease V subunit beta [Chitinimonas sp. PSY-7]|uniref:exodeoxyribonuclease V subunit beta n=1 Tax=Chitinimonas sp. PSY-7 TaxID=3459088 RepID=UPI00403FD855
MSAVFSALGAPLDGLNLIEASAGTGKTWTIAALYARLVLEKALSPEQILVVTYTKAATAELRGRIRARLGQLADSFERNQPVDDFCAALLAATTEDARLDAAKRLRTAVSGFDAAAVFTIHSFCQRALGENALLAGLELEREFLADEADLLQSAADAAWKAEVAAASPAWLGWLIANKASPENWLKLLRAYLSHSDLRIALPIGVDAAACEMRFQEAAVVLRDAWVQDGDVALQWLATRSEAGEFNGSHRKDWLAGSIALWRQWLAGNGLPNVVEDEKSPGQAESKVRRLYARELANGLKTAAEVPAVFNLFEPFISTAMQLQQAYALRLAATHARLIGELAERVAERKLALGVMSFHDLLVELAQALDGPNSAQLIAALQDRYHAALIDEFQDTDPLQFRIFDRLFNSTSNQASVFLVGDPKQAIYAFRGAELHAYLAARAKVDLNRRYSLSINRRSTPALVDAVGQVFSQSATPFLLEDLDYPVVAAEDDKPILTITGQLQPAMAWEWLGDEALGKGEARSLAAARCADRIAALLASGVAKLGEEPLTGGDIAVLAGAHAELEAMQLALSERGVPSVRLSQESVFDTDEARDLLQLLSALIEPSERAVRAAMATVSMGLEAADLYARLHDEAAWEATLADFRRWQQLLHSRGAMAALNAWLIESGCAERIAAWRDGERRLTNLLHLFELIELARRERPGLAPLLAWYRNTLADSSGENEGRLMRLESDASRVRLVTIHASKGLEYPVVFCPFLWEGALFKQGETLALCHEGDGNVLDFGSERFEARRAAAKQEKLAEKLRLLYVALTRPKSACFIAWGEVSDLPSSALGWLLAGGAERDRNANTLKQEVDALIAKAGSASIMGWTDRLPDVATEHMQSPPTHGDAHLAKLTRRLSWQWRMSSFSALTAGVHAESPDYDANPRDPWLPDPDKAGLFDTFPAGPRAGICLHTLFEHWDFRSRDRTKLEALAHKHLLAHGFDADWTGMAADLVEATMAAPVTEQGRSLYGLPPQQCLVELEFTYRLQPFAWAALAAVLADPVHGMPPVFAQAAAGLSAEVGAGYLKGFIDLACELDGRHYVLDWKSNRLLGYGPAELETAMAEEHYYLQALIYCVALHRYLCWRKPGYDYDRDFGGALYLFLRGMPNGGVWRYRPTLGLIHALETLLCGAPR